MVARLVFTLALTLGFAPLTLADEITQRIGSFSIDRHRDEMTDADRSSIATFDENGSSELLMLTWTCREDGLNIMYGWGSSPLTGDSPVTIPVQMRFDEGTPSEPLPWNASSSHNHAFVPDEYVSAMTEVALRARTLTLRVHGKEKRITGTFDLTGLRRALATLPCAR